MHKEIHEQPDAIHACLAGRLSDPTKPLVMAGLNMTDAEIKALRKVVFTACGTAYHAGLVGRFLTERLARIPAEGLTCPTPAASSGARDPVVLDNTLCVVISQSGETADTLVALRDMKAKGARIVSRAQCRRTAPSRANQMAVVYIQAGPESLARRRHTRSRS